MKLWVKFALAGCVVLGLGVGCKSKPREVAPANAGDRNDNCQAKNDCKSGLSCISGRCQPTNYALKTAYQLTKHPYAPK